MDLRKVFGNNQNTDPSPEDEAKAAQLKADLEAKIQAAKAKSQEEELEETPTAPEENPAAPAEPETPPENTPEPEPAPKPAPKKKPAAKKPATPTTPKPTPQPTPTPSKSTSDTLIGPVTTTFYGHPVRRFYQNDQWRFAAPDIIQIPDFNPEEPANRYWDPQPLEKKIQELGKRISYKDPETNKDEEVVCITAKEVFDILKLCRGQVPGPFPEWLEGMNTMEPPATTTPRPAAPAATSAAHREPTHPTDTV